MSKATDSGRFLCSSTHMILIPRSCTRGCMQTDCTVSSYKKLLGIHEDTQAVLMRKFLIFCGTLIHWELAWALSREYDFFSRKPCFSLNMVGFGSPRQPRKKSAVKTPVKEAPPVDKTPLPNAPTAAGELPYDAFSQFPPLSPQNQASLRKVDGENDELTPEASQVSSWKNVEVRLVFYWLIYSSKVLLFEEKRCRPLPISLPMLSLASAYFAATQS